MLFEIETPTARLDRLIFSGTLHITEHGTAWFCHMCKRLQANPAFEDSHGWFDAVVTAMGDHADQCLRDTPGNATSSDNPSN
jgi:hypothetical protein